MQEDGWDVPKPQVLLYLWVLGILHYTIQTCTLSFLLLSPVVFGAALKLLDNEGLGLLLIQYTINLPVYKQPS